MYRFEPGSYQTPSGFLPALACFKIGKNKMETLDYILTNTKVIEPNEEKAVDIAEKLLSKAFKNYEQKGNEQKIANSLRADGFKIVENPKFAK
jgi:hypothetical protein